MSASGHTARMISLCIQRSASNNSCISYTVGLCKVSNLTADQLEVKAVGFYVQAAFTSADSTAQAFQAVAPVGCKLFKSDAMRLT